MHDDLRRSRLTEIADMRRLRAHATAGLCKLQAEQVQQIEQV
ncbi:MAG: hypothetical protein ACYCVB_19085 [Bacilli bacterium]